MGAMGDVLQYRPPKARAETTAVMGMVIFLSSWAMMFASLFFAYAFVRTKSPTWPPDGLSPLPRLLPAASTVVLGLSSLLLQRGIKIVKASAPGSLWRSLLGAVLLGVLFLTLQTYLWLTLYAGGLKPSSGGSYTSVFYGLTWLHALHVVVGLVGLAVVARRAFAGEFNAARYLPVRLWAMYWHFVGVVWLLMFVSVFLL
jgi:heme/copper-type cytochrome/quinol oxidase subunit 3